MISRNEQVNRNGTVLHPCERPPVQRLGLNRKVKWNGFDPPSMNQLPINKTLIRSGVQENREREGLILPQEDRFQKRTGDRGIEGAARQDPSGYW